jgi:hypothetical protein
LLLDHWLTAPLRIHSWPHGEASAWQALVIAVTVEQVTNLFDAERYSEIGGCRCW